MRTNVVCALGDVVATKLGIKDANEVLRTDVVCACEGGRSGH